MKKSRAAAVKFNLWFNRRFYEVLPERGSAVKGFLGAGWVSVLCKFRAAKRRGVFYCGSLFFAASVFSCAGAVFPDYPALIVSDSSSGRVFGSLPLRELREFSIEFTHSVNQSPVREFFVIEGGRIRLAAVRFYSFGAGIQSDLEEGQTLSRDGDAMIISGFAVSFSQINLTLGPVSDHRLLIGGQAVNLRELCGENARLSIFFSAGRQTTRAVLQN